MTEIVYPVRGGMEDWAYGGGWEGYPIINQCTPKTYPDSQYPKSKTDYTNKSDALKSIMFLLESSQEKTPEMKLLGRRSLDCLINMKQNPFFNTITTEKEICLDQLVDGYIPRILRLSLSLIDLLQPYINFDYTTHNKSRQLSLKWIVGGALKVDSCYVLYDYVSKREAKRIQTKIESTSDNQDIIKIFKQKSKLFSGKGIWGHNFSSDKDIFKLNLKLFVLNVYYDDYLNFNY